MEKTFNFEQYFEANKHKDLKVVDFEVPDEVKKTTISILKGLFDKVKSVYFHSTKDGSNFVEFIVTDDDFIYVDDEEDLEMEMTSRVKRKREYEVTLKYHDKIDESNTLIYEVIWGDMGDIEDDEEIDELDNLSSDDDWYKSEVDGDTISDDSIDNDDYMVGSDIFNDNDL